MPSFVYIRTVQTVANYIYPCKSACLFFLAFSMWSSVNVVRSWSRFRFYCCYCYHQCTWGFQFLRMWNVFTLCLQWGLGYQVVFLCSLYSLYLSAFPACLWHWEALSVFLSLLQRWCYYLFLSTRLTYSERGLLCSWSSPILRQILNLKSGAFSAFLPLLPIAVQFCPASKLWFWTGIYCLSPLNDSRPLLAIGVGCQAPNGFLPSPQKQDLFVLTPLTVAVSFSLCPGGKRFPIPVPEANGFGFYSFFKSSGFVSVPCGWEDLMSLLQCLRLLPQRRNGSGEGVGLCTCPSVAAGLFLHTRMPFPPWPPVLLLVFREHSKVLQVRANSAKSGLLSYSTSNHTGPWPLVIC